MTAAGRPVRPPVPASRRAVVVGGGIAGATAALRLADAGLHVTLLESRPRLGGMAFSFHRDSPVGPLAVDNGQHVHLGCCTAYQWLLQRVGAGRHAPTARLDVPVLDAATGRTGRLRRNGLPAPFHLAASLAAYPHLTPAERAGAAGAALALRRLDPADPDLDGTDFASWLARHGQTSRAVAALWDLVGLATLNARAPQASLALAAMVFRTGLLSAPDAADIGVAGVPLGVLHDTRTRAALHRAGVDVRLQARVRRLVPAAPASGSGAPTWRVHVDGGGAGGNGLTAGTVVLAVPHQEAHRLLPSEALGDPDRLLGLGASPIVNIHVVYDRRVLRRPFFAALGSPVQWVFDRTSVSGMSGPGQYLTLSQSAAYDDIHRPTSELRDRYLPELRRMLPAARGARLLDFFVTRERNATFAPAPGSARMRPNSSTRLPGVHLAGAWTDTGWPATMESAVRSGLTAARTALRAVGRPCGVEPSHSIERRAVA